MNYLTFPSFFITTLVMTMLSISVNAKDESTVITGTQVTYSLASTLLSGTTVEVVNIPADGRRFNTLKDYIERRKERFSSIFQAADAVVSMTNALPSDPLYRFAREANISLVNIDAAQPWSFTTTGVSIVTTPTTNVYWDNSPHQPEKTVSNDSPYFWLSLSNAVRMSDIVANDLARTFPQSEKKIRENSQQLKNQLLSLFHEYQQKLLEVDNISVFALTSEFVYLSNDLGLYVDGYFIKQDIDWTATDLTNLSHHLQTRNIKVVLHKWQPSEAIQVAIQRSGATLVVLDTADPGMVVDRQLVPDGYQKILQSNLEKLYQGLQQ